MKHLYFEIGDVRIRAIYESENRDETTIKLSDVGYFVHDLTFKHEGAIGFISERSLERYGLIPGQAISLEAEE